MVCPQLYIPEYSHLMCIPCRPLAITDRYFEWQHMWEALRPSDTRPSLSPLAPDALVISPHRFDECLSAATYLAQRVDTKTWVDTLAQSPNLGSHFNPIKLAFSAAVVLIRDYAGSMQQIARALAELQRLWLDLVAIVDYMTIYRPRILNPTLPDEGRRVAARILGAWTGDATQANAWYEARIPVYLVLPASRWNRQKVIYYVDPKPYEGSRELAIPPPPMIYAGRSADPRKYAAIYKAACAWHVGADQYSAHLPSPTPPVPGVQVHLRSQAGPSCVAVSSPHRHNQQGPAQQASVTRRKRPAKSAKAESA